MAVVGFLLFAVGIALQISGQFGPKEFPDSSDSLLVASGQYLTKLNEVKAQMAFYRNLSIIGHFAWQFGGFFWLAGLILSRGQSSRTD